MWLIFSKQNTDGQEQLVFDYFLIEILDCLQHSERVECWVQKMVVLAVDTFFVPSAFNHCQMVCTFFPKTKLAFLFSPFDGDSQKTFVFLCFFNKKLDKTQQLMAKQHQHPI